MTAGGVPLKEAAIAAAKASGIDLEKVGVARGLIAAAKASGVETWRMWMRLMEAAIGSAAVATPGCGLGRAGGGGLAGVGNIFGH